MGDPDGLEHFVFGQLAGESLDHQHRFLVAGNDQIEIAFFEFVLRGKGNELAVDPTEPDRADRSQKGERREAERDRSADHGQHVAVVLPIAGQHERLDLNFVAEPLGKEGTDRAIHQPRGQRFLGRRTPFAFEKSAGEFAGRGCPLAIIAGQREEVGHARAGRAGGDGR